MSESTITPTTVNVENKEPITTTTTTPVVVKKETKAEKPKGDGKKQQENPKKGGKKGKGKFELKTPKGTQDYGPSQMVIREKVFGIIKSCFNRHGAVTIETPVFELKETLTGKYGEDSKLIYDLVDQGGELSSLRYDLTVPFARYVAMNGIKNIKRYHIARVYRRDNPVMTKGRFREFYQCDFDIAGQYDLMVPDSECLRLICEILDQVQIGNYRIKLNHRKLLDSVFAICGVPEAQFRPICSAVDKLDKSPWEEVRKEMVEEKKLDPAVADKIEGFVKLQGKPFELLEKIESTGICKDNAVAVQTLADLRVLFEYLEALGCIDRIHFDLSLARGLDYYTGVIYEAILTDQDRVGSIAAGGRYDGLVGMYGSTDVPAVGFSIGIERIFTILEEEESKLNQKSRQNQTQVFIAQWDKGLIKQRLKLANELWNAGISTEYSYKENPAKGSNQLKYPDDFSIPFVIYLGNNEVETDTVSVKNRITKEQVSLTRANLVESLKKLIQDFETNPPKPAATTSTPSVVEKQ